jgi:plastocyanin
MRKTLPHLRLVALVLVAGIVLGLAIGVVLGPSLFSQQGGSRSAGTQRSHTAPLTTVTIPRSQDIFEPFILEVQPNTTLTWQNNDSVAHVFMTTPDQNTFLNLEAFSLRVPAGGRVYFTFKQPGLYHYYDTTMATWDAADARVAAREGVPHFPLAMDGVIWVQGTISNLPSGASNHIPHGHDDFVSEFIALDPGLVALHNLDTDPHFISDVSGWSASDNPSQAGINPADIGLNRIDGTATIPGGDTINLFFSTPGLYYYYCANHARINATLHRAEALLGASEYPIPMEGFVLVVDN